jgi:hypothetical protein
VIKLIHGLSEEEKFKVIRPLLGDHILDQYNMPVIHRTSEEQIDFENMIPVGIQNLTTKENNSKKLVLPFNYDKNLLKYWNDPMKYIPRFQSVMAIGTPDYSVYPGMNKNEIQHNVFMSRWLGCLWQSYQCIVLPVISWWGEDTYDICFSGIEKGSIVIISTLGCRENPEIFLNGFNEMKNRISPPLIIVYGNMLDGMTGRFINIKYTEAFNKKKQEYEQLSLFKESNIFERRDVI